MLLEPVTPAVISGGLAVTETLYEMTGSGGLGVTGVPLLDGSVGEEVQPSAAARASTDTSTNKRREAFLIHCMAKAPADLKAGLPS
jgi:hypothetical protein